MLKQAKKHFRLAACCWYHNGGLHRELVISCDPEYRPYIRARRRKNAIKYAGNFDYSRENSYHRQHDKKSWKSRCRKRHQWEKHFHTVYEFENAYLVNEEHAAKEIYQIVQEHSDWVKFDIRNNPEWEAGIDWLIGKKKIECRENRNYPWEYPVRTIRALQPPVSSDDPVRPERRRFRHRQKNKSLSNEPLKATPLLDFHTSLPRSIRRNWRYQQWENVMEFANAEVNKNYLALLNAALRLKLKIMYTPYDPENNPYAQLLWNLSKTTALRDPASVALNRCYNADTQFNDWVNQCFFDYPLPDWAYRVMQTKPEEADRKAFISWGCGQSPRSIFGLSKQENGIFHEIHFAVPSVRFALAYSAAMARHCTRQLALAFAEALHGRDNANYPYYLQRVRSLAEWFAVQPIDDFSQVRNLMDYFYRENYFLRDFALKGRTLKSMLREMDLWHLELHQQKQGKGSWQTHNLSHVLEKDEVIFEELDNAKELQYEGRRQHNCVASYLKKCMENRCAIVAMSELNSGQRVTLEINISDKKIVQAKGKCNAKPTSQELKYICRYARDKQLEIVCAA